MTEEQIELAKRAVACKGWRFMGGMRVLDPIGPHPQRISDDDEGEASWRANYWLPDLTDPATLGCLLALVREAWGDPHASASWDYETNGQVVVACSRTSRWIFRDRQTEAEALVAALEAAP